MKRNFQVRPFGCNFLKKETRKAASEKVCALQSKKFRGNIKMSFLYIFVMIPGGERSEVPWKQKKIR